MGSFIDNDESRDLSVLALANDPRMHTYKCITECRILGYKFAGLQAK